jgi:tetratricopeptide (TPR) repeat protein
MFQSLNEPQSEAIARHLLGETCRRTGVWQPAEHAYREAACVAEASGDKRNAAGIWNNLAILADAQGKPEVAESWLRKTIAEQRQSNPKDLAASLNNLAGLLQNQASRLNEAQVLAEEALAIRKTLDEASAEIWKTYGLLAVIADKQQQSAVAKQYRHTSRDSYLRFKAMPYQMRQHAPLIADAIFAVIQSEKNDRFMQFLTQPPAWAENIVQAIRAILNGERNAAVLLEPLSFTEAASIHLILKGIENPESLETLFNA